MNAIAMLPTTTPTSVDISRIHAKAMLVTLNISQWSARKIDKKAASDVASMNNVASKQGTYYKSLIEGGALDRIKDLATQARAEHYRRTLPWSDAGPRVLPNLGFMDYMAAMGSYKQRFEKLVGEFVATYPLLRYEAQSLLGNLFHDSDYPHMQTVADKFSFKTAVNPLPIGEDFRCDLGSEEVDKIRAEITANTAQATTQAVREAYERVQKVVDAFVDRLQYPDTKFQSTLVTNARDLAEVLPSLNFTEDPLLATIAQRLKDQLCIHEPEALRSDVTTRREAYENALAMKEDLMGFFSGDMQ